VKLFRKHKILLLWLGALAFAGQGWLKDFWLIFYIMLAIIGLLMIGHGVRGLYNMWRNGGWYP